MLRRILIWGFWAILLAGLAAGLMNIGLLFMLWGLRLVGGDL